MSIAAHIFSEQDWPKFHKDLLIKGLTDDMIESFYGDILIEFKSACDEDHYQTSRFNKEIRDNFNMIASANLEREYREVLYFLILHYHTEGWVSVDILAINDGQRQKWLKDLLSAVDFSGNSGNYELEELTETHSILNDILFSEETGEYLQEKTATEKEKRIIDELQTIHNEKKELLEQHQGNDKYLLEYQQAYNDWNDAVKQMRERINYVDVEFDIIQPARSILKWYALTEKIAFNIESVQISVLKINHWFNNNSEKNISNRSELKSNWEYYLNQIFESHKFTSEEWKRLVDVSEQELIYLIESIKNDFNSEVERISEDLPVDFNRHFKGGLEKSSLRYNLKSVLTFLYHHYLTNSFSISLSLEKELGNTKWGTILLKEVRDHEMKWLQVRNIDEYIFETIYPPELEDDDKNWNILDEDWFNHGTDSLFLHALNDISIDEDIALKSLRILDELASSNEDSKQSLDTKSFLSWVNGAENKD